MIAFDTETKLIKDGLLAPPLVSICICDNGNTPELIDLDEFESRVLDADVGIIGHNGAYDFAVMAATAPCLLPKIFKAFDDGRVIDTQINEQLIDLGHGKLNSKEYSLAALCREHLGVTLDKDPSVRLAYGQFYNVPYSKWPKRFIDYALADGYHTWLLGESQLKNHGRYLTNAPAQAMYHWAFHLMSVWGIRTDWDSVTRFSQGLLSRIEGLRAPLMERRLLHRSERHGIFAYRKDKAGLQALVIAAFDGNPPRTDKGAVKISGEVLEQIDGDPAIDQYLEYIGIEKLLSTYVPVLAEGTRTPINARFRMLETGRRGATKNMQTLPRYPGTRECYVPRVGNLYVACDYDSLEFRTLGQVNFSLFGSSPIAEMYIADPDADPHTKFAAEAFLAISYEEGMRRKAQGDKEIALLRQAAKAYNFGLPGGLGIKRFRSFAKSQYGIDVTEAEARAGKAGWIRQWNLQPYFDFVSRQVDGGGQVQQLFSHRVRGGTTYTAACNTYFQGLAADGASLALYQIAKACYAQPDSVLYGCRSVNFIHDEIIVEIPNDALAHERAYAISKIMNESMSEFCPDVPIRSKPVLMTCWSKDAKQVFRDGRLVAWSPK